MRCPKCRYIAYEDSDRCRNCGYSFAMATEAGDDLDLPIQSEGAPIGPLADLNLTSPAPAGDHDATTADLSGDRASRQRAGGGDLPLFINRGRGDDAPLVSAPAVPRAPLAVRRSKPATVTPRGRADFDEPALDLGVPEERRRRIVARDHHTPPLLEESHRGTATAGLFARFVAGIIDTAIIGSIQAGVTYLTLRLCGLQIEEIRVLPAAPMTAFLLLLAGGYFIVFITANGQTIGKMAARIRVVPTAEADRGTARVPFGSAILRTAASLISLLPAGAGYIPALLSSDRRAWHDRLAQTRVIKKI